MSETIDQDIVWLRTLATDMEVIWDDAERLQHIADRLEEIEAIMPLVFQYVPHEDIDRTLDRLEVSRRQLELPFSYGGTDNDA